MIQMERLHGISSFHGLTPASSMPSDLIRGCGAGSESRLILYGEELLRLHIMERLHGISSFHGLTGESRLILYGEELLRLHISESTKWHFIYRSHI